MSAREKIGHQNKSSLKKDGKNLEEEKERDPGTKTRKQTKTSKVLNSGDRTQGRTSMPDSDKNAAAKAKSKAVVSRRKNWLSSDSTPGPSFRRTRNSEDLIDLNKELIKRSPTIIDKLINKNKSAIQRSKSRQNKVSKRMPEKSTKQDKVSTGNTRTEHSNQNTRDSSRKLKPNPTSTKYNAPRKNIGHGKLLASTIARKKLRVNHGISAKKRLLRSSDPKIIANGLLKKSVNNINSSSTTPKYRENLRRRTRLKTNNVSINPESKKRILKKDSISSNDDFKGKEANNESNISDDKDFAGLSDENGEPMGKVQLRSDGNKILQMVTPVVRPLKKFPAVGGALMHWRGRNNGSGSGIQGRGRGSSSPTAEAPTRSTPLIRSSRQSRKRQILDSPDNQPVLRKRRRKNNYDNNSDSLADDQSSYATDSEFSFSDSISTVTKLENVLDIEEFKIKTEMPSPPYNDSTVSSLSAAACSSKVMESNFNLFRENDSDSLLDRVSIVSSKLEIHSPTEFSLPLFNSTECKENKEASVLNLETLSADIAKSESKDSEESKECKKTQSKETIESDSCSSSISLGSKLKEKASMKRRLSNDSRSDSVLSGDLSDCDIIDKDPNKPRLRSENVNHKKADRSLWVRRSLRGLQRNVDSSVVSDILTIEDDEPIAEKQIVDMALMPRLTPYECSCSSSEEHLHRRMSADFDPAVDFSLLIEESPKKTESLPFDNSLNSNKKGKVELSEPKKVARRTVSLDSSNPRLPKRLTASKTNKSSEELKNSGSSALESPSSLTVMSENIASKDLDNSEQSVPGKEPPSLLVLDIAAFSKSNPENNVVQEKSPVLLKSKFNNNNNSNFCNTSSNGNDITVLKENNDKNVISKEADKNVDKNKTCVEVDIDNDVNIPENKVDKHSDLENRLEDKRSAVDKENDRNIVNDDQIMLVLDSSDDCIVIDEEEESEKGDNSEIKQSEDNGSITLDNIPGHKERTVQISVEIEVETIDSLQGSEEFNASEGGKDLSVTIEENPSCHTSLTDSNSETTNKNCETDCIDLNNVSTIDEIINKVVTESLSAKETKTDVGCKIGGIELNTISTVDEIINQVVTESLAPKETIEDVNREVGATRLNPVSSIDEIINKVITESVAIQEMEVDKVAEVTNVLAENDITQEPIEPTEEITCVANEIADESRDTDSNTNAETTRSTLINDKDIEISIEESLNNNEDLCIISDQSLSSSSFGDNSVITDALTSLDSYSLMEVCHDKHEHERHVNGRFCEDSTQTEETGEIMTQTEETGEITTLSEETGEITTQSEEAGEITTQTEETGEITSELVITEVMSLNDLKEPEITKETKNKDSLNMIIESMKSLIRENDSTVVEDNILLTEDTPVTLMDDEPVKEKDTTNSAEDAVSKESILSALGLQSLHTSASCDEKSVEKPSKPDSNYTGTLKAVIKLNRNGDKKSGARKMFFKQSEIIEKESPSGEMLEYRICTDPDQAAELEQAVSDDGDQICKLQLKHRSTSLDELSSSSTSASAFSVTLVDPLAGGDAGKDENVIGKDLVIPEKSSSFSIHPGRLCSDICTYCFGKFGCLDTPCHLAQLKNAERQQKILANDSHLKMDSCLCDACYRYVLRRANCPPVQQGRKQYRRNYPPQPCCVQGCTQSAHHFVKRKWLVKLRKSISKKLDLDMDKNPHLPFPLCNQHYYWVDYFTVCGICKKRLTRNHMYALGTEACELNVVLKTDGIPVRLSDKLFLCKLCRYYSSLRLKYKEAPIMNSSHKLFLRSYRKKILTYLDITVEESEEEDEGEKEATETERLAEADEAGTTSASAVQEQPVAVKAKKRRSKVFGTETKKRKTLDSVNKSTEGDSMESGDAPQMIDYSYLDTLQKKMSANNSTVVLTTVNQDTTPVVNDMSHSNHSTEEHGTNVSKDAKVKSDSKAAPRIQVKFGNKKINVGGQESGKSVKMKSKCAPVQSFRLPGENELPLTGELKREENGSLGRNGWEKYTLTVQFDKETKRMWNELQRPYGNQSSFLRHLVMLEKYWREGSLVLSANADPRAVKYNERAKNRVEACERTFRPSLCTASSLTSAVPTATITNSTMSSLSQSVPDVVQIISAPLSSTVPFNTTVSQATSLLANSAPNPMPPPLLKLDSNLMWQKLQANPNSPSILALQQSSLMRPFKVVVSSVGNQPSVNKTLPNVILTPTLPPGCKGDPIKPLPKPITMTFQQFQSLQKTIKSDKLSTLTSASIASHLQSSGNISGPCINNNNVINSNSLSSTHVPLSPTSIANVAVPSSKTTMTLTTATPTMLTNQSVNSSTPSSVDSFIPLICDVRSLAAVARTTAAGSSSNPLSNWNISVKQNSSSASRSKSPKTMYFTPILPKLPNTLTVRHIVPSPPISISVPPQNLMASVSVPLNSSVTIEKAPPNDSPLKSVALVPEKPSISVFREDCPNTGV